MSKEELQLCTSKCDEEQCKKRSTDDVVDASFNFDNKTELLDNLNEPSVVSLVEDLTKSRKVDEAQEITVSFN